MCLYLITWVELNVISYGILLLWKPNSTSEEEEPHAPAHVGIHLAGKHLGRKGLGYWWTPNWTWGSIMGSVLKSESILKFSSAFYPVPKVPSVLSFPLIPPATEELVTNTHTFRYVMIYLWFFTLCQLITLPCSSYPALSQFNAAICKLMWRKES